MKPIKGRTQRKIEERWGVGFWQLVADFASQGLTRQQTAQAMGMSAGSFSTLLANHPDLDPFPTQRTKAQSFMLSSGKSFKEKVLELARTMGLNGIAHWFGWSSTSGLIKAIRAYGFWDEFKAVRNRQLTS